MVNFAAKLKQLCFSRTGLIIAAVSLVLAFVLFPASAIFAHSPLFPEENHDPSNAYQINNPDKSWAIYTSLCHPDKGDYYKFTVSKGDKIDIALMTLEDPSVSGFRPSFALMVPGSEQKNNLPAYIEIPAGYGTIVADGKNPAGADYEPFSPGWIYDLADLTMNAPAGGTYYIAVYDDGGKMGNYVLPVGYIESFTVAEWLLLPYIVHNTYVYEGQNLFVTFLPFLLTLVIGSILLLWRSRQGKSPQGISKWLAAIGGLAFLGTTVSIIYQMVLAMTVTGFSTGIIFTFIFVVFGLVLGLVTLLYAARERAKLTLGRRIGLLIIGILAPVGWAGLWFGTALVVLAAIVSAYRSSSSASPVE